MESCQRIRPGLRWVYRGVFPVRRYDVTIGTAARDIAAGSWVHERLLQMPAARTLDDLPMATVAPPHTEPLTGHTDVISALSFSADGNTLASTGAYHTVRLWDVPAHRALGQPLHDHTGWVSAVAFNPHAEQLASAGEDGTVRLWDPILWSHDRRALQRRICSFIRRNLSRTEWAQYLAGQAYRDTCPRAG